ncbi:hypothetical protein PCANC_13637 [Puccinia coronata f. sp. avenae]|uniref:Retrovirus-related Pol polyprotein from transposon TNT 1-94-like beta-barrel domain-containing protein n=1 Tax=Puccinia coronata f. sp. avenae TaxID=200324 RepID=A0A2N5UKB4_9BASI|nr:hypothetical protein PCANC_13637 [Puccinia coronata f. sp. avenae]
MSDSKNLPILTGSNFTAWKMQVQGYCMQHGLYKYLNNLNPPAEDAKREGWDNKRLKVAGILYQCMGEQNHQRSINKKNAEDPQAIWNSLVGSYKSNSVQNQSLFYQEFPALSFKSTIAVFLDELNAHVSALAAVGLIVGEPKKADIKELLLAEHIVAKLHADYQPIREILYQKQPLTLTIVCNCLDSKRREAAAPSSNTITMKQESALKAKGPLTKPPAGKDYPQCPPGWHNPATTGHTKADCCMKRRPKPTAKAAATSQPDNNDNSSSSISTKANSFICVCQALLAIQGKDTCFLNSRASHHMFSEKSKFSEYQVHKTHIELADGNTLESPGKGYVHLEAKDQSTLKVKALHIPELAGTLISFGCLYKRSCDVVCTGKSSFNLVNNNTILLSAKIIGGTCNVKLKSLPQEPLATQEQRL